MSSLSKETQSPSSACEDGFTPDGNRIPVTLEEALLIGTQEQVFALAQSQMLSGSKPRIQNPQGGVRGRHTGSFTRIY